MKKPEGRWCLKPMKHFLIWLCQAHPRLYTIGYLGSFFLLLAAGAATPFIVKSIVYPVCTQQSKEMGIIDEVVKKEEKVIIFGSHGRSNSYSSYRFVVDGLSIQVPPKDYRNYEKGDLYPYFLYRRNGKSAGDYHDYKLGQGMILFVLSIFIFMVALSFIFTETSKKELVENWDDSPQLEKLAKQDHRLPERPKFESCSAKELYEQCLLEGIKVRKGKSRDKKYLMKCLMGAYETKAYHYQSALKEKKRSRAMNCIFAVGVMVMALNYMRHLFYCLYNGVKTLALRRNL